MRSDETIATRIENTFDVLGGGFGHANYGEASTGNGLDGPLRIQDREAAMLEVDKEPVETGKRQHLRDFRTCGGEQRSDEGLNFPKGVSERSVHADKLSLGLAKRSVICAAHRYGIRFLCTSRNMTEDYETSFKVAGFRPDIAPHLNGLCK